MVLFPISIFLHQFSAENHPKGGSFFECLPGFLALVSWFEMKPGDPASFVHLGLQSDMALAAKGLQAFSVFQQFPFFV